MSFVQNIKSFIIYFALLKELFRYALRRNLIIIADCLVRMYFRTIRIESFNEEMILRHLESGGKVIAALWHQRIFSAIGYAQRFGAKYHPSVMISKSRDGDLAAEVFSRMNFRPVRGSSSRDGKQALAALVDDLKDHPFAVYILDGPQGPRGVVKPGLIALAKRSGVPIVPFYLSISRAWVLRGWDRCLVPKPFSKIVVRWGQLITVPKDMDERAFEEIRLGIEKEMLIQQRIEDYRFEWEDMI